eukprot:scaffold243085_cov36-Tisochrysis_lutea.AAC.3
MIRSPRNPTFRCGCVAVVCRFVAVKEAVDERRRESPELTPLPLASCDDLRRADVVRILSGYECRMRISVALSTLSVTFSGGGSDAFIRP